MSAAMDGIILIRCWLVMVFVLTWADAGLAVKRTVVLTNGNVLEGDVQQLEEHVLVQTPTSELRIPIGNVAMVARNLQDAYRIKTQSISNRPQSREALIRWCLRCGLRREANFQLDQLRQLTPNYAGLEVLRQRVRTYGASSKTELPGKSPLDPDTQLARSRLDSLSKETVSDFVRTFQPLMINRCGQANCHGKANTSSFSLVGRGQAGLVARATHRNLGAVLGQLESVPVQQSPLWMSANSPHGSLTRRAMSADELERFYWWIERVKTELEGGDDGLAHDRHEPNLEDPFDPGIFNQEHHPRQ